MNYVDENGNVCEVRRKLKLTKNGEKLKTSVHRMNFRKPTKAEKSEKLAGGKLFRKCAKKYIKSENVKKRSIKMDLIDAIYDSYGMRKYTREVKGRKDFHDISTTNYLIDESKESPKIKKTYSRMNREKVRKILGGPNSAQKYVMIQFSNRRCFYRKLNLSQYMKMLKIARVAIQTEFYVFYDGSEETEPSVVHVHQDRLSTMRHMMDEYGDIIDDEYPICDRVASLPTMVITSINDLIEWHCNLAATCDALIMLFETMFCYDYCEDDYKIMVYQTNGKLKYYNNLVEFLRDYGFHDPY